MRLTKSMIVGIIAGLAAAILVVAGQFAFSVGASSFSYRDAGGGIEAASLSVLPSILVGMLAAVVGVVWQWKRSGRIRPVQ
jgi:uncharacterized membrane protein